MKKKKEEKIMLGDTAQLRFNNRDVRGFWGGDEGLLIGRPYTTTQRKKIFLRLSVLLMLKSFKDFQFSSNNPRMVLTEKRIFDDDDQ